MLLTWNSANRSVAPVTEPPATGWVHAATPTPAELDLLEQRGVPRDFLTHALDPNELPRLDRSGDATLAIMRVPIRGEPGDLPFRTTALGVIALPGRIVTVTRSELELRELVPADGLDAAHPHRAVLHLLARVAELYLAYLHELERHVDRLEDELETSLRNREVLQLLRSQKSLVHFTTGLGGNEIMLTRLQRDPHFPMTPDDHALLEDVAVELHQAIEVTRISEDILSQMMDAFASIISNNLNVVMKVLTSLTILLAIPTMVASFYGMNVGLPLQHEPVAFWLLVVASAALSGVLAVVFYRRRWL